MNTKLRQKAKNVKLVPTERRRNHLVLEPNYHAKQYFTEIFLANRNEENSKIKE